MSVPRLEGPSWDQLFEVAVAQEGHITTQQAAAAGYSSQLLLKHVKGGRLTRVRRGVYRIVHYPAGEHEDLVALWLWSEQAGVFSHETALMLHDLGDALPSKAHLTLPASWEHRRLRVPPGVRLYFADVPRSERTEVGAVPLTTVPRTLRDCMHASVSLELVDAALHDARVRKLLDTDDAKMLRAQRRCA